VAVRQAECPREAELLEALLATGPDGCPEGLRSHVEECVSCGALLAVALPLRAEHEALVSEAPVPSSAVMWRRLEMRGRREATARALRPIAAVQAVTLACAVGMLAAVIGQVVPPASRVALWLDALGSSAAAAGAASIPSTAAQVLSPGGIAFGLAGALFLIVTPVAVYLALSDR
jgi:hypothetical protein